MEPFIISDSDLISNNLPPINSQLRTNNFMLKLQSKSKELFPTNSIKTLHQWVLEIFNLNENNLSMDKMTSRLTQIKKKNGSLRGDKKIQFLNSMCVFPSSTVVSRTVTETVTQPAPETKLTKLLQERRGRVVSLTEQKRVIKRKLDRSLDKCETVKKAKIETEKKLKEDIQTKNLEIQKLKIDNRRKARLHRAAIGKTIQLSKKVKELKVLNEVFIDKDVKSSNDAQECLDNLGMIEKEVEECKKKIKEQDTENSYLRLLLQDNSIIETFDEDKNCFNTETVECVMKLSDCNVAANKVPDVIKHVSQLCQKTPSKLPSEWTVNRINISKSHVATKQLENISDRESLTLYSDETSKFGKSFEVYAVTDKEQNSYLLGLREMVNKSSATVLDTLNEILDDINNTSGETQAGHLILSHIKNTMSDRAATEKKFQHLLEDYRAKILPKVMESWTNMSDVEQNKCSAMNNFFCGLHLLVGCADVCSTMVIDFEKTLIEENKSASFYGKKKESGTIRLIRCCSKAFARGADEKSGVHGPWKTYIESKSSKVLFLPFKHNRFNIVFLLGGIVYYHQSQIQDFLHNIHGVTNGLLEQISTDIKSDIYLAGCRSYGLISKLITSPLWRLIESKLHILRMNIQYLQLCKYLEELSASEQIAQDFLSGKSSPFEYDLPEDDEVLKALIKPSNLDQLTIQILMLLSKGILTLLQRQLSDQLPGGKFAEFSEELLSDTESVMKHNKLPEFFFGQLDFLLRYRPNASLLCNESYLMFSHNKTGKWLEEMDKVTKENLLTESRKKGKEIKKLFKERLQIINTRRQEVLKKKEAEIKLKREKMLQTKEDATNKILYYGLWQSKNDVENKLAELPTITEKKKALQSQLNFRKKVLCQKSSVPNVFNFSSKASGKSKQLTVFELSKNLCTLIDEAFSRPEQTESSHPEMPLLVGKRVNHKFSNEEQYAGLVISVVPGYPSWYNIKYDDYDDIYVYDLLKDYRDGDLSILVE